MTCITDKHFSKKFLFTFYIFLWLIIFVCAIFYLRSAQLRINEIIIDDFKFNQISKPPFIEVSVSLVETKDIYAPWLYSELLFGLILLIILLISPILIYHRFIKRRSLFDFKNKKIKFFLIICFSLLVFADGIFGILTYQWKYQWWNDINPSIRKLNHFLSTQPSWIVNIANNLIPSSFKDMIGKSYLDLFAYTYATFIFGFYAMILSFAAPLFVLLKQNNKLSNRSINIYKWVLYVITVFVVLAVISFYLMNFINDNNNSKQHNDIWNSSSSYSTCTLLISILLFFSLLFYSYLLMSRNVRNLYRNSSYYLN